MKLNPSLAFQNNSSQPQRGTGNLPSWILGGGLFLLLLMLGFVGLTSPEQAPQLFLALGLLIPAVVLVWYYPALGPYWFGLPHS